MKNSTKKLTIFFTLVAVSAGSIVSRPLHLKALLQKGTRAFQANAAQSKKSHAKARASQNDQSAAYAALHRMPFCQAPYFLSGPGACVHMPWAEVAMELALTQKNLAIAAGVAGVASVLHAAASQDFSEMIEDFQLNY